MEIRLDILRKDRGSDRQYMQSFSVKVEDENASVATALTLLDGREELLDTEGKKAAPIEWERNCLQKKCGACAMRINGKPRLACEARLREFGGSVLLEPLRKFPVIADLLVDRQILHENLKTMKAWLTEEASLNEKNAAVAYEGSRCLQCGCCLEVCPNFYPGGTFSGTAALAPTVRLLSELPASAGEELRRAYRKHIFNGCGKSLACRNICPAGLDVDELLVNSNALAVWKRKLFSVKRRGS